MPELDLDQALADVLAEAFRDEVPDVIRNADFVEIWPAVRAEVVESLASGSYRPLPATVIEVPKSRLATRPIAILALRDRVVYQAIMRELASPIDAYIFEEVRSARLLPARGHRLRIAKQSRAWTSFQKRGRELCEDYEDVCLLSTDITSYFEFIDLDRLSRDLLNVPGISEEIVRLLLVFLRGITDETTNLHGVPQGPEVSSLLGNLYLMPLDATLRTLGLRFLRFQDDIKVFANEPHELRRALLELMPVVRALHINLSTEKTKLLMGNDVLEHFEDMRKDVIQYGLDAGAPDVRDQLHELFDAAVSGSRVNERDVRFAVYRFEKRNDPHAVPWIIENLVDVPYLASLLVRYLSSQFTNAALGVETAVRNFLENLKLNLSPVVELHLLRMLANAPTLQQGTYDLVWRTLRNQSKHRLVRQFAARCIGRHLRSGDGSVLHALFQVSVDDPDLRRALLVAIHEAGSTSQTFLRQVEDGDPQLRHTARYLRQGPRLPAP